MIPKRFEELKLSGNLPTPSGVGLAILRHTQKDDVDLDSLVSCIQADPALTGRIVKLANSSLVAGVVPATTVRQASMRLGVRSVRNVALSFSLLSANRFGACGNFDYDRYWSWSLACAAAARVLAGEDGAIDPAEAFTCGLLSRIGMLALASVHPVAYARVLGEARGRTPTELLQLETREFDIQHWEVAGAMMSDWGLPDCFVGAVVGLGGAERGSGSEEHLTLTMARVLREASVVADQLVGTVTDIDPACGPDWIVLLAPAVGVGRKLEHLAPVVERAGIQWREWTAAFRLPTAEPSRAAQSAGIEVPRDHASADLAAEPEPRASDAAVVQNAPLDPSQIQVLAIDDDPRLLKLLVFHLREAGYQVASAENGELGLALALERQPHVVVTDWIMPQLSGLDVCRSLRSIDQGRRTYIVILTARDDEDRIVDAFAAGADDYVTKPFNPRILLARVQAGTRLFELQRQVDADRLARMQQAAELGLMTRKLRAAALTDVLTELPNRRYAMLRLTQEWEASTQSKRPLSIVLCDLDHFKAINDERGHEVGDAVLRSTAATLRAYTRRGDVVCRLGGEEFLIINVNSDARGAAMCAERLRTAVQKNLVRVGSQDVSVTASLGWAERGPATPDVDALLRAADEAVYSAKAGGRNIVRGPLRRSA